VGSLVAAATVAGFLERLLNRFAGFSRALLDAANQFFLLAFGVLKIVVRELGPFLLQLALGDVPVAFDFEGGHNFFVCFVCLDSPSTGRQKYSRDRRVIRMSGRGGESCQGVQSYLDWVCVSVVVVVTGAGTVVCCDVVVVLCVALSVSQPVIDKSAEAATQQRMIFFISMIVVWFVKLLYNALLRHPLAKGYGV